MLIDEIVALAADDAQPIGVVLRKCLILAHQTGNKNLKTWATNELNGYADIDNVPEYRVTSAQATGNFVGWGRSQASLPIPPAVLEEKHKRWATKVYLTQAITVYADLIRRAKPDSTITLNWPTNLALYYQDRLPLNSDMRLISAYQEIPIPSLVELIETVRNRVLSFALEIKAELGQEQKPLDQIDPALKERVDQIFIQHISGGNFNIASGGSTINLQQNIEVGNWQQLTRVLEKSGLSEPELDELSAAVGSDKNKMGPAVLRWIKEAAPKVVSGGVKIGTSVGQAILVECLKRYLGLPN